MLLECSSRPGHGWGSINLYLLRKVAAPLITIPLSDKDLARVRLSPSPLWETVCSFGVLMHPESYEVHSPWVGRARRMLRGVDLSPMVVVTGVGERCPDYLSPPPDASRPTFGEELEVLRATPPEVVRAEVRALMQEESTLLERFLSEKKRLLRVSEDPEGALRRLVDALGRYHELTIAPYWPRIRELLDTDTLRRGQVLALGGPQTLLSGLTPKVAFREGSLELDNQHESVVEPSGRGITLVPCAFSSSSVPVLTDPYFRPTLAYAPRGVARLWTSPGAERDGAGGGIGCRPSDRPQGPPRASHHDGARPGAPPEPRRGFRPSIEAQGSRARRASSKRQEGVLSPGRGA